MACWMPVKLAVQSDISAIAERRGDHGCRACDIKPAAGAQILARESSPAAQGAGPAHESECASGGDFGRKGQGHVGLPGLGLTGRSQPPCISVSYPSPL